MKLSRSVITPFVALIFIVVGISGIVMFFHLFDSYTEVAHELFGICFVAFAIGHVIVNWTSLKIHFRKKLFVLAAIVTVIVAVALVVIERLNPPVDNVLLNKLMKAPIVDSFKVLGIDYPQARRKLENKGISIGDATTLEQIWERNNVSPEEVIDSILE